MLNSLSSILTIFIMIGIGFFLAKKGFLNKDTNKLFSNIVIKVSLPLLMVVNIQTRFTKEKLINSLSGALIVFMCILTTYFIAVIISSIFNVEKEKRGMFCTMCAFANSVFIGLPVNITLFGDESAPYVFIYFIVSSLLFWTLGVNSIRRDNASSTERFSLLESLKKLISPPIIGFIVGVSMVLLQVKLPSFMMDSFRYIGNLTTPLGMFFIGTVIYSIDFKNIKLNKTSYLILIGRFVIAPSIMLIYLSFFQLPNLMEKVFVIEASMPILMQSAIVCEYYELDSEYASIMVGFSTVLSILIIPIYSFIV